MAVFRVYQHRFPAAISGPNKTPLVFSGVPAPTCCHATSQGGKIRPELENPQDLSADAGGIPTKRWSPGTYGALIVC